MSTQSDSRFVYVTFIRTTPDKLWAALTDPAMIKRYWFGMTVETAWTPGASWRLVFDDGRVADAGEIAEFEPPKRLAIRWRNEWNPEMNAEGFTRCTMEIEAVGGATKLTVTHVMERPESRFIEAVSGGWPKILSNLKSLLETGEIALAP